MSEHDPFDVIGNAERAQRDKAIDRLKRRQYEEDLRWFLHGARGRRVMWGLLSVCGVFRSSFTGNSETFFREGERNIGLRYMKDIMELCPDALTLMTNEARENERKFRTNGDDRSNGDGTGSSESPERV